ncbi:MAG: type I-D CRISPR-associated protein Cas5/Csc1 [bacterium]
MRIYRCSLRLLDYLFFATTERGKTFETGPFIHNYALAYALAMVGAIEMPGDKPFYFYKFQKPNYEDELRPLNDPGIYITPAQPRSGRLFFRQTQFNTIREGYMFGGKERSIAYPDWGFLRMVSPGSEFVFFVMAESPIRKRSYIRLGKFLSKAGLNWWEADSVSEGKGEFECRHLLNWRDLVDKPKIFDLLPASLPSKLVSNAHFRDSEYWIAKFKDYEVRLPRRMKFLPEDGQ